MAVTNVSLLLRLRRGADPTSWNEFVALYEPLLRSYVAAAGLQPCDAADVLQEVFVRLLRGLPRFEYSRSRGRFRDWLRCIARNAVLDWHRRQSHYRRCGALAQPESHNAAAQWNGEHRRLVLEHALGLVRDGVSQRVWVCFERYVLQGENAARVAEELGFARPAVYVIASRIRKQLQRKCSQFDEDLCNEPVALSR